MNDENLTQLDEPASNASSLPPPVPRSLNISREEDNEEFGDDGGPRRKRRTKLFCFHCNRPEGHFVAYRGSWLYSFFTGMTFGLIKMFGPYKCQCCGKNRLMALNVLNPKWHFKEAKNRSASRGSYGRRRKKNR